MEKKKYTKWCNMKRLDIKSHNIHTAFFSAFIFAIVFVSTDFVKNELYKLKLNKTLEIILNFLLHFIIIILVSLILINIYKIIYNFGDKISHCR